MSFTQEEEQQFLELSRQPDLYEKLTSSISPSISGDYTVDIKKAIACLLFSGSRKVRSSRACVCVHVCVRACVCVRVRVLALFSFG